ncbi:hypothetical protein D3C73_1329770 [compost metagenome]
MIAQAANKPKTSARTVASSSMFLACATSVSRTRVCETVSLLLTSSRISPWAAMRLKASALAVWESRYWLTAAR